MTDGVISVKNILPATWEIRGMWPERNGEVPVH